MEPVPFDLKVGYPTGIRKRKIERWAIIYDSNIHEFRITGVTTHDPELLDFVRFTNSSPIVAIDSQNSIVTTESGTTYEAIGPAKGQNLEVFKDFLTKFGLAAHPLFVAHLNNS